MNRLSYVLNCVLLLWIANNFGAFTDPYNHVVIKRHHHEDTALIPEACLMPRHKPGILVYDDGPTVNKHFCIEMNNWQLSANLRHNQTNDWSIDEPSSLNHTKWKY